MARNHLVGFLVFTVASVVLGLATDAWGEWGPLQLLGFYLVAFIAMGLGAATAFLYLRATRQPLARRYWEWRERAPYPDHLLALQALDFTAATYLGKHPDGPNRPAPQRPPALKLYDRVGGQSGLTLGQRRVLFAVAFLAVAVLAGELVSGAAAVWVIVLALFSAAVVLLNVSTSSERAHPIAPPDQSLRIVGVVMALAGLVVWLSADAWFARWWIAFAPAFGCLFVFLWRKTAPARNLAGVFD